LERYQEDLPAAVRVHPLRWPRHRDPRNLALLLDIIRVARNRTPDVIHFLGHGVVWLGHGVVWLALALPVLRRRPVVVTVHDVTYHPGDTQTRSVPMATIQVSAAPPIPSSCMARDLGVSCWQPVSRRRPACMWSHIPCLTATCDWRSVWPETTQEGRPLVLFFGRVMAYKGLGLLIDASDHVVNACTGVRIVVAGRGPDLARWGEPRSRRGLGSKYAIATSPMPRWRNFFLDADLFVMPYIEASQSGVAAPAAGFVRPVIATAAGELGALIKATNMGQVVPTQAMGGRCNRRSAPSP
jgi:glycosyltransferase involved in cell wall biosynthesis